MKHTALTMDRSVDQNYCIKHTMVTPSQPALCCSSLNLWFHLDAVGSTAFHPFMASLLSVSGSRHFLEDEDDDDLSTSDEDSTSINGQAIVRRRKRPQPVTVDSSVKLWDFRPSGAWISTMCIKIWSCQSIWSTLPSNVKFLHSVCILYYQRPTHPPFVKSHIARQTSNFFFTANCVLHAKSFQNTFM